jgi:hypothetical protein
MYAKKKKKPMYGKGGTVKYLHGGLHGGPVKSDSTNPVKSDSTKMAPLDLFGIDAVLKAREEGPALDLFGIDAVLDAREAAGLSRNPMDDFKPISDKAKAALEKLRVYFGISDEPKKMMKGGMMPKYPGGGMMPRKRRMMYQNGGPVDFGSDAVGEVLAGRASAANPNDMDFIRDLMVRAFNESKFGGENRGRPYRIAKPGSYDEPFFYNEGDEKSRQDILSDIYEASGRQSTGVQGDYAGPYNVMMNALNKIEGLNEDQRIKASTLASDMARALYR